MYNRLCKPLLSKSFFLYGSRGTGKSSLLKSLFADRDCLWFDLLDDDIYRELLDRPQRLAEQIAAAAHTPEWVVIDEVQKVPAILDVVHQVIAKKKIKFALTGSSARKLKRGSANLLAGRALVESLFPLTFVELGGDFSLERMLRLGSLPEVVNAASETEAIRTIQAYASTYLREEILQEQLIRNIAPFRRFLDIAAQSNGQILNYAKIGRDCGVDSTAIERYFQILEDTLVGFFLPPFHRSVRKRQSQRAKFYFFDTGVKNGLDGSIHQPIKAGTYQYGRLFEHLVILEIHRLNEYLHRDFKLSHLRTKDDAEIDLIIERPGQKTLLIEIKSTDRVDKVDINKLIKIGSDIKNSEMIFLCSERQPRLVDSVQIMPWQTGILQIYDLN